MLAGIIARYVGQRRLEVVFGGSVRPAPLSRVEEWRDRLPAPGAAEVEAVEVRDLAVAAVADRRGGEQGGGLATTQLGQESAEPGGEVGSGQDARHAKRFGQRRRQEFVAARFPRLAIAVGGEP